MTLPKRLEHIWEYYRWHILLGLLALGMALGILAEWNGRQVPDYEIAVICRQELPEEALAALTDAFSQVAATLTPESDKVSVTVMRYDPAPENSSGGQTDLYNGVALNAELTGGNCLICIADETGYEMLRNQSEDFLALVGEEPYVALSALFPELPESLRSLRVCLRSAESVFLETAESAKNRFEAHKRLLEACMS